MTTLYKYSGAGNDFIIADGRKKDASAFSIERITSLCDRRDGFRAADGRTGSDGFIILRNSERCDFSMEFYNPDGSSGMMCGNGGRCIVAFASFMGIKPADGTVYSFEAADGIHTAEILSEEGNEAIVKLRMTDARDVRQVLGGYFLNTGTRHFVLFVDDVESIDISSEGPRYRHDPEFAPQGANVNFVCILPDGSLKVRTFEKGVEAETLACGTGITASAIAAHIRGIAPGGLFPDGRIQYHIHARQADLSVDFIPASPATDIHLTGPAGIIR